MSFWKSVTGVLSGGVSDVAGAVLGSGGSGGGGSGGGSTTNEANQTGASEQGVVATGQGVVAQNGVSAGGTGNKNNLGGEYNNAPGGTISVGLDANQLQTALKTQSASQLEALDQVLNNLSGLAESKQTDGISGLSKTALWAIAIVVIGVVAWAFNRK